MQSLSHIRSFVAATALAGVLASPAMAMDRPDGTITFSGGSVAFIAGVSWGSGTLTYHGRHYRLRVRGLSVGDIGASKFSASGAVYHLTKVSDISGTYGAAEAAATVGGGGGGVTMKNDKGVVINASSSTAGLQLTLAPKGVEIKLK
jgi:hypothetical protein